MTMSVKMLDDIAIHAEGLANEAKAMAEALRAVVDDCAVQLAEKKSAEGTTGTNDKNSKTDSADNTARTNSTSKEPEWVAEAEKNVVPPEAEPGKKLTIAEVRAYVAGRTTRENRAQIKAILQSFGVAKLTELSEDKYATLMEEVAKL